LGGGGIGWGLPLQGRVQHVSIGRGKRIVRGERKVLPNIIEKGGITNNVFNDPNFDEKSDSSKQKGRQKFQQRSCKKKYCAKEEMERGEENSERRGKKALLRANHNAGKQAYTFHRKGWGNISPERGGRKLQGDHLKKGGKVFFLGARNPAR